jgi:hypothetical protein
VTPLANEDSIDDHLPFDSSERSEVELIDHLFGFKAGTAGQPSDETKSPAWKRGWAEAQKQEKSPSGDTTAYTAKSTGGFSVSNGVKTK